MDENTEKKLKNKIYSGEAEIIMDRMGDRYCDLYYHILSEKDRELIIEYMRNNGFHRKKSLGFYAYTDVNENLFYDCYNDDESYKFNTYVYRSWNDYISSYEAKKDQDYYSFKANEPEFIGYYYYITDKGWELLKANLFNILLA